MSGFNHDPAPQFGKAEYVGAPGNDHCQYCHQAISGTYYRVNKAMACPGCAEKMRGSIATDSHATYMRALLFGIGAAIAGLALYATVAIVTGIVMGYLSLAVGWIIGKAMLKGSRGAGGRRYQITAAALTYLAVSLAAVPVGIHYSMKRHAKIVLQQSKQRQSQQQLADEQRQLEQESGQQSQKAPAPEPQPGSAQGANQAPEQQPAQAGPAPVRKGIMAVVAGLALWGIESPFLRLAGSTVGGIIGFVILMVGIRIAWQMTAGHAVEIFGPFEAAKNNPT
jgi:hypothetical protein